MSSYLCNRYQDKPLAFKAELGTTLYNSVNALTLGERGQKDETNNKQQTAVGCKAEG